MVYTTVKVFIIITSYNDYSKIKVPLLGIAGSESVFPRQWPPIHIAVTSTGPKVNSYSLPPEATRSSSVLLISISAATRSRSIDLPRRCKTVLTF